MALACNGLCERQDQIKQKITGMVREMVKNYVIQTFSHSIMAAITVNQYIFSDFKVKDSKKSNSHYFLILIQKLST